MFSDCIFSPVSGIVGIPDESKLKMVLLSQSLFESKSCRPLMLLPTQLPTTADGELALNVSFFQTSLGFPGLLLPSDLLSIFSVHGRS